MAAASNCGRERKKNLKPESFQRSTRLTPQITPSGVAVMEVQKVIQEHEPP